MPEINLTLPQTDLLSLVPALPSLSNVSSETTTDFADIFSEIVQADPQTEPSAPVEVIRPQAENPIEAELLFWLSRSAGPALELETQQPELLPEAKTKSKEKPQGKHEPQHPLLNQEGAGGGLNFLADSLLNLVTT